MMTAEATQINDNKKYFSRGVDSSPFRKVCKDGKNSTTVTAKAMVITSKNPATVSSHTRAMPARDQATPFKVCIQFKI